MVKTWLMNIKQQAFAVVGRSLPMTSHTFPLPLSTWRWRGGNTNYGKSKSRKNITKKQGKYYIFILLTAVQNLVSILNIFFVQITYKYLFSVNLLGFSKLARVANLLVIVSKYLFLSLKVHDRNFQKLFCA